eukprot:8393369-Alexandrium_andersonii.AAC.1
MQHVPSVCQGRTNGFHGRKRVCQGRRHRLAEPRQKCLPKPKQRLPVVKLAQGLLQTPSNLL